MAAAAAEIYVYTHLIFPPHTALPESIIAQKADLEITSSTSYVVLKIQKG